MTTMMAMSPMLVADDADDVSGVGAVIISVISVISVSAGGSVSVDVGFCVNFCPSPRKVWSL